MSCSGVCKLTASPEERIAAFATESGKLYSLSLVEAEGLIPEPVMTKQLPRPASALAWCSRKQQLVAACGASANVYRRAGKGT